MSFSAALPRWVGGVLFLPPVLAGILLACGGGGGGGEGAAGPAPQPPLREVTITGTCEFPADPVSLPTRITVSCGDREVILGASGTFSSRGWEHAPTVITAYDSADDTLLLLNVLADPRDGTRVTLNVHSTAVALVLLNPPLLTTDADELATLLKVLERLPELGVLETLLSGRLADDPKALAVGDPQLDQAIVDATRALIAEVRAAGRFARRPQSPRPVGSPSLSVDSPGRTVSKNLTDGDLVIDPEFGWWELWVKHIEGETFELVNGVGRWALCTTPTDEFWVAPNGGMIDWVFTGTLFPYSRHPFTLSVYTNEPPKEVNVYGFGFAPHQDNRYDALTAEEELKVLYAGAWTFASEFIPHLASFLSAIPPGSKGWAQTGPSRWDWDRKRWYAEWRHELLTNRAKRASVSYWLKKFLDFREPGQLRTAEIVTRELRQQNYNAAMYQLFKQLVGALAADHNLLLDLVKILGLELGTNMARGKLLRMVGTQITLRSLVLADAYGDFLKTTLGFWQARYKSPFEVSRKQLDFGYVAGTVLDRESRNPIAGATVALSGDSGNPYAEDEAGKPIPGYWVRTTDASGYYVFGKIIVGQVELEVAKSGYATDSRLVTVEYNETVYADFELDQAKRSVVVEIHNEIYIKDHRQDIRFDEEATVDVSGTTLTGSEFFKSVWIYDGIYRIDLEPGAYTVSASHDDYREDSIQIAVNADLSASVPRDLVLKPIGYFKGTIEFDMDNDGLFEKSVPIDTEAVGAGTETSSCGTDLVAILAVSGSDRLAIVFDKGKVTSAREYPTGPAETLGCPGGGESSLIYVTGREQCLEPISQYREDMQFFMLFDGGGMAHCNCGIASAGSVFLDGEKSGSNFGTALTQDLTGFLRSVQLPGWNGCTCYSPDATDPGVNCARVRLNLDFKALVGTQYRVDGL